MADAEGSLGLRVRSIVAWLPQEALLGHVGQVRNTSRRSLPPVRSFRAGSGAVSVVDGELNFPEMPCTEGGPPLIASPRRGVGGLASPMRELRQAYQSSNP